MRQRLNKTYVIARCGPAALALLGLMLNGCQTKEPDPGEPSVPALSPPVAASQSEPPATQPSSEGPAASDALDPQEEPMNNKDPISALVWMRSEHSDKGATLDAPAAPEAESKAARHFRSLGFAVTEPQYGQFSIEGSPALFQETLGEKIETTTRGKAVTEARTASGGLELDKSNLPPEIAQTVHVITFSEPPAFGPSSY